EHHVPAGQGDLAGQAGTLVADRVLGDLHQHRVTALERELDAPRLALQAHGVPVDLAGVEHGVAALADVHERRLHGGQHVLDLAHVDVADHRGLRLLGDVVLDEHVVLEHRDLGAAGALAHHHRALDGLAAGEELRLGDDAALAAGVAALAAALALGLEAGGALDGLDLVARFAGLDHGVRRVGGRARVLAGAGGAGGTTAARARGAGARVSRLGALGAVLAVGVVLPGILGALVLAVVAGVVLAAAAAATAASSATAPTARAGGALRGAVLALVLRGALRLGLLRGVLGAPRLGLALALRGAAPAAAAAAGAGAVLLVHALAAG